MSRFTEEELFHLTGVPTFGFVVIAADMGGMVSAVKEMAAIVKAVAAGPTSYPNNELIQIVHEQLNSPEAIQARAEHKKAMGPKQKTKDLNVVYQATFDHVEVVKSILKAKAAPQEANEYREWILVVAQAGAEAAKEGGFLGIGAKRVSDSEQQYLDALRVALYSS